MKVKSVFIKELSQRVKILQAESKKEIAQELVALSSDIAEYVYKAWVLETHVVSISSLFNSIVELTSGNSDEVNRFKDTLYEEVIKLNPLLNPDNIYISENNTLTLTKDVIKLIDCQTWKTDETPRELFTININEYYALVENARKFDHYIETEEWPLFDGVFVSVRRYNKSHKVGLLQGYSPKTMDDVKYFVVVTCIDNFQQLYSYIQNTQPIIVPFMEIINSLYDLSLRYNPFLQVKVADFKKINQAYRSFREGSQTQVKEEAQLRKSLSVVPKKEILNLESLLKKQIFGQDEAIKAVVNAVQRAYLGIKDPATPIGAFFFYGSTSTGKTELAKVLAKTLTKSRSGLLKISCNTINSSHSVHTLIGSPPGYVGYEDKGLIEKGLENSNFKIILFDEVEKANPKLYDVVLEMLEEGEILMANGNIVNVSNCLIIFTSNMGQGEANQALNRVGFTSTKEDTDEEAKILASQFEKQLKETLKPEFMARLNGIFYFPRLTNESLFKIAEAILNKHIKYLKRKKLTLEYSKSLIEFIVTKCQDKGKGLHARHIKTFIDMEIMKKLGDFVLELKLNDKQENIIQLSLKNSEIAFSIKPTIN